MSNSSSNSNINSIGDTIQFVVQFDRSHSNNLHFVDVVWFESFYSLCWTNEWQKNAEENTEIMTHLRYDSINCVVAIA